MFEEHLNEVLFDAIEYGTFNLDVKYLGKSPTLELEIKSSLIDIHRGFKKAQLSIIEKLLNIQDSLERLKEILKKHRINREKDEAQIIHQRIEYFIHQERVYRRVADAIAWQMFHAHTYYPRRLLAGRAFSHNLNSSNLSHALHAIEELHKADPCCFALLSDITSFIGIGDILLRDWSGIKIIELKDGKINQEIKELLNGNDFENITSNFENYIKLINDDHDYKKAKQAHRMMKQSIKMQNLLVNINLGKGIDSQTRERYFLHNLSISTKSFRPLLVKMIKIIFGSKKEECHSFVERCLCLGVYKERHLEKSKKTFQEFVCSLVGKNLPIIDFVESGLLDQLAQPIFILPLSRDIIINLVCKKIKVYMAIDFDRLIELFKDIGMDTGWASRAETEKVDLDKSLFRLGNRAIYYKFKDESTNPTLYVGGGLIQRIVYNHNLPSSIAQMGLSSLEEAKAYKEKTQTQHKEDNVQNKVVQEVELNVDDYLGM